MVTPSSRSMPRMLRLPAEPRLWLNNWLTWLRSLRHELASLACAGMTPAQIARQLNCSEKNVYAMLAEAIAGQQVSLEQALDLPEELLGEIQDAFLEEDGELPPVAALEERFGKRVPSGVLHCVRAALQVELES